MKQSLSGLVAEVGSFINATLATSHKSFTVTEPLEKTGEAMGYMLTLGGGGKRIRPVLAAASALYSGGSIESSQKYQIAIEYIHTYTLIIDDIQDDDSVRRGEPTCHVVYGVNTSILAAARLYEHGLRAFHNIGDEYITVVGNLLDHLHQGQAADLNADLWPSSKRSSENLAFIQSGKTASLLQLALIGGCAAANVSLVSALSLIEFGYFLGLAFQAKDDILAKTSSIEILGKKTGELADMNKFTFVDLHGSVDAANTALIKIKNDGIDKLDKTNKNYHLMEGIMNMAVDRLS